MDWRYFVLVCLLPVFIAQGSRKEDEDDFSIVACATCRQEQELGGWLATVFSNIRTLPKIGSPSRILTFGEHAYPAVIGRDNDDVMMALGTLGSGKVAAFGHPLYIRHLIGEGGETRPHTPGKHPGRPGRGKGRHGKRERRGANKKEKKEKKQERRDRRKGRKRRRKGQKNGDKVAEDDYADDASLLRLHQNLLQWINDGQVVSDDNICRPQTSAELQSCLLDPGTKVLLGLGETWPNKEDNEKVKQWVQDGGALLHGFNPQENPQLLSILDVGFYTTLVEAGIVYEPFSIEVDDITVSADQEVVSRLVKVNIRQMPDQLIFEFERIAEDERLAHLLYLVQEEQGYFPPEVSSKLLKPLERFAISQEPAMIWPEGSIDKPKKLIESTPHQLTLFSLYYTLATAHLWREKAPHVSCFPGDIEPAPQPQSASLSFSSKILHDNQATGYYLLPGQEMTVTVTNEEDDDTWTEYEILIGCHTDNLDKRAEIARWPRIRRKFPLTRRQMTVRWMFGGLVTVKAPAGLGKNLKLTITGVVPTPYLDTTDAASVRDWEKSCERPGLYADVKGARFRFTLPKESVCHLSAEYLAENLRQWDGMVESGYELMGISEERQRNQWLTLDIQTGGGLMHSGYPIVGRLSKADPKQNGYVFNGEWDTHWGMYHEFGHNIPHGPWKWKGVAEVNCNIISLLQMERMAGLTEWPMPKLQQFISGPTRKYFTKGRSFEDLQKITLVIYSQLIRDFGWGCMHGVFLSYNNNSSAELTPHRGDYGRQQEWVIRWSQQVGYNVCPLFHFWLWPLAPETEALLSSLPAYFPDDQITRNPRYGINRVLEKYPDVQREVTVPPTCPEFKF